MIAKLLHRIGIGLKQLRYNTHYLLVAFLLIVLPGLFIWVTQHAFTSAYQLVENTEKDSIGLLHESLAFQINIAPKSARLQEQLQKIAETTPSISRTRILTLENEEFIIVHSNNADERGMVAGDNQQYLSSAGVPADKFFIVDLNFNGTRVWHAYQQVNVNGELYYIFTEHSFAAIDASMLKRQQQTYLALSVIYLFLIALAMWLLKQTNWHKKYVLTKDKLDEQMLFTNSVAHELRAPLTAIRGYVSFLLESKVLAGEERQYTENINTATRRLIALINDFLEVARIQSGKLKLRFAETDVRSVINAVASEFNEQARQKGLVLLVEVPAKPVHAETDPDRLQQVLTNLVSNALKYTKEGSVSLVLKQTKLKTQIIIKDTGQGISAEDQRRLFEAFTRLGSADDGQVTGTGLGMWITKQLVALLHGSISVESIEGVGTHVKLTFDV